MSKETWNITQVKPKESLKETFKQRLDGILNKQLTVENIETFANEALEELTTLTQDVLKQYGADEELEPANLALSTREQEDDAFKKLELPNIQEILQRVIEKKDQIDNLKKYISEPKNQTNKLLVPPEMGTETIETGGGQGISEKKFVPRLLTLLYILETDFEIEKEEVEIIEGKVTPEMVRKTPYVRVDVPDIGRTIYICDEEGNASYVFDTEKLEEAGIGTDTLDTSDKGVMSELITQNPGIGIRIVQNKHWRMNMTEVLGNDIPEEMKEHQTKTRKPLSEFKQREKKEFLQFDEFQREVIRSYNGEGNVQKWYTKEKLKHLNWPHNPDKFYKNLGWIGWSELVGIENTKNKEFLPFDKFQEEVRAKYKEGNITEWYHKEILNHNNWPSTPHKTYKNLGWIGWPELVGKENILKKEYPPFDKFQEEVREKYNEENDISEWYPRERKNHPNWPSKPERKYKNKGWIGWLELVGIENTKNKEFLPFDKFQEEVRAKYKEGNITEWYRKEKLNHNNWPSNPDKNYKGSGWISWPDLVGKE